MTPFHAAYARYRFWVKRTLTGKLGSEAMLEHQDALDDAWNQASRALPPLSQLGHVRLTSRRGYFLLHAVGRQAAWREESFPVGDDALALTCEAP